MASDSARREDQKICPKRTFPSNFVKLVSKILYLFLAEKMVVCCCLFVVVCLMQLCPILAYFFLNWSTHRAEKDASKEKVFDVRFGNCFTPKVPRFCRFTKMQLT